ncbi:hypothetical protein ACIA8G_26735 [Lentzea sp. NPDC051213]|uniref:hypothetical protein n=1 Tax=Lentzea sp. NPDC051213 TaxID=3364126 RepID=UPI003796D625
MRTTVARSIAVGLTLAAGTLLSACSGQTSAGPPTQTSTPTTTSGTASATPTAKSTAKSTPPQQSQVATGKPQQGTKTSSGKSVNCSANGGGKVGPAGGKQVDLIAEATQAGTVGCTEAFNVISDYYRDAPTKAEGTARVLVVQGWTCMADTGAQGSGAIGCGKGGLSFHTGQS